MSRTVARVAATLAAVVVLFGSWSVAAPQRASALDPFTGYLMAHFTEGAIGEQIYFAHSRDGLHWNDLNDRAPVLLARRGAIVGAAMVGTALAEHSGVRVTHYDELVRMASSGSQARVEDA